MVMVNAAMAYVQLGETHQAEKSLAKAVKIAPDNAAAHFNLGLLRAEQKRVKEAERSSGKPFASTPRWPRQPTTSAS